MNSSSSLAQNISNVTKQTPAQLSYKDPDLGFSFLYPNPGYSIVSDDESKFFARHGGDLRPGFISTWGYPTPKLIKGLIVKKDSDSQSDIDLSQFTLWVYENPGNLDAAGWYRKYWYYPFVWGDYEPRKSLFGPDQISSVSGQPTNYRIIDYQTPKPKFTYLNSGGRMYLFRTYSPDNILGDQILGTFKLN